MTATASHHPCCKSWRESWLLRYKHQVTIVMSFAVQVFDRLKQRHGHPPTYPFITTNTHGRTCKRQVGRFDARCLSTAIHGTARLLSLRSSSQLQEQQQGQQQSQQEHQQHQQEEKHALALLSLLVDAMTQRMMQEALLVAAAASIVDKGGKQQQQQQRSHGASNGSIDKAGKQQRNGSGAAPVLNKGGKQRSRSTTIGVSPQDVAMALSSMARATAGGEGQVR